MSRDALGCDEPRCSATSDRLAVGYRSSSAKARNCGTDNPRVRCLRMRQRINHITGGSPSSMTEAQRDADAASDDKFAPLVAADNTCIGYVIVLLHAAGQMASAESTSVRSAIPAPG